MDISHCINNFLEGVLEYLDEGVYVIDSKHKIVFWNSAAEKISGYSACEVIGSHCSDNILQHVSIDGVPLCLHSCPLHKSIDDSKIRSAEVFLHHKKGHRVPVKVKTLPLKSDDGIVVGGIEIFSELVNNWNNENIEKFKKLAMYDSLTEIANRRYLDDFLSAQMKRFETFSLPFAIAFIDIDLFKNINDTYGHSVGDSILKMIANSLKGGIRSSDLLARYGGEEFMCVFSDVTHTELLFIGQKLLTLVRNSIFELPSKKSIQVTVSIGLTVVKEGETIQDVITRADQLLYVSKNSGRDCFSFDTANNKVITKRP